MTSVRRSTKPLELVIEAKVADLLNAPDDDGDGAASLEPSGVCVHEGACYLIFDDSSAIARIEDLTGRSVRNRIMDASVGDHSQDREDITFDPISGHFFVLVEAVRHHGQLLSEVLEYSPDGKRLGRAFLELVLETQNKGLEGLSCIVRDGSTFLLGLCEGNHCRGGAEGRRPGGGRIHIFKRGLHHWVHVDVIRLPKEVDFVDYASVAVSGDRIAVVSQTSSALWIGKLAVEGFAVKDGGTIYPFPNDGHGRVVYGNVEGVSWLSGDQLVMVSDKAARNSPALVKERSIRLFALPA